METGDPVITDARKSFNTGLFDILEGFKPESADPVTPPRKERIQELIAGFVFPFRGIKSVSGSNTIATVAMSTYVAWISLLSVSGVVDGARAMAWVMYLFFVSIVAKMRTDLRQERNVYGNSVEDFITSITLYPFAIAQMEHETKSRMF